MDMSFLCPKLLLFDGKMGHLVADEILKNSESEI